MSTVYGNNAILEQARTVVVASLQSLVTAMVTVSPAIVQVYDTHLGEPALVFPCATVGVAVVESNFVAQKASAAGSVLDIACQVDVRVLIGNANDYLDEVKVARLNNSIMNWLEEHRADVGSGFVLWKTARVENAVRFEDTDTVGGRLTFIIRAANAFVAA